MQLKVDFLYTLAEAHVLMQLEMSGENAEAFLESVMVADLRDLNINTGTK